MKNNFAAFVENDIIAECVTFAARTVKEAANFAAGYANNGEKIEILNRKTNKTTTFYKGVLGLVRV